MYLMATAKKGFPPIVIVLIVVGVLVVAAGAFFMLNKGKMMGSSMMGGNAFTSIKDALTKSVSLECEYTDGRYQLLPERNKTYRKNSEG
jgi:hypothetical protein